jgi:hypothetical protein
MKEFRPFRLDTVNPSVTDGAVSLRIVLSDRAAAVEIPIRDLPSPPT